MEKENRKGLIYEFPMGVAVLKGGHSLQIDCEFPYKSRVIPT